jgi:DNA polymerase-1
MQAESKINDERKVSYIYCNSPKNFEEALVNIETDINGVDTETTGLDPTFPNVKMRLVQICGEPFGVVSIFDAFTLPTSYKKKLKEHIESTKRNKIFHNAKFDIKHLYKSLGVDIDDKIYDTMLASQLIAAGDPEVRHALDELVYREFGERMEKEERLSNWSAPILEEKQLVYAARDTVYLHSIREKQIKELRRLGLLKVAGDVEFFCISSTAEMELAGIRLDFPKWCKTADRNKLRAIRMQEKISKFLQPPNSNPMTLFENMTQFKVTDNTIKQKCKELKIELPIVINRKTKLPEYDKKGEVKRTISMDYLEPIKDSHPLFPMIIKHATHKKAWTSYGRNWIRMINPVDGRIHVPFKQIGTETGRFSVGGLHQIPQEYIYRRNFIPDEGNILIWADYSQIELRILADITGDVNMIAAFVSGVDLHTYTASQVFNVDIEHVTSAQRRLAKNLNFGIVYGIGAPRFAESAKISLQEAEDIIRNYFRLYRQLDQWLREAAQKAVRDRQARTISGRLLVLNFDESDKGARSLAERNGKNMPIQGSSADITKVAMGTYRREIKKRGLHGRMINCAHDEIITEAPVSEKDLAAATLVWSMETAGQKFLKRVPVKVDIKMGYHWSK